MENTAKTDNSIIARSASKVMLGGVFSLLAGLINQVIIARLYGASAGMDAYLTAIVVPFYLQTVLYGSLAYVFIPAFVKEQAEGNEDDAWALAGTFFMILLFGLSLVAAIGSIFSAPIIQLVAPEFTPEKSALAARMLPILMLIIPFSGLGTLTISIQNARNKFFWPSFGNAVNSIASIIVLILLAKNFGPMALCWGFLASTVSQAAITVIPVLRHGWKKTLPLRDPRVREMGRLVAPLMFFGLLTSSINLFERYFASGLPDGQLSYIGYANKIANIFVGLLAASISSAIFPTMARVFTEKGINGLNEKSHFGLRLIFAVGLPSVFLVGAVAHPLITVLFQRGAFKAVDTLGVGKIVIAIMLGDVLFRMVGDIFKRTSFVLKDTVTPPMISSLNAFLYIASGAFFVSQWGYTGLVWARTVNHFLGIVILGFFVMRKLPGTDLVSTARRILEYLGAALAAYLASRMVVNWLSPLPDIIQLGSAGLAGSALYLLILYWRDREIFIAVLQMSHLERIFFHFLNNLPFHSQKTIKPSHAQEDQ